MYALVPDCLLFQPFVSRACISGRKAGVKPFPARILGLFQNSKDSAYFYNRLLGMGRVLFLCFRTDWQGHVPFGFRESLVCWPLVNVMQTPYLRGRFIEGGRFVVLYFINNQIFLYVMSSVKVLTVNPGSTSTKIAVFVDEQNIFQKNIKHSVEELAPFAKIADQFEFRRDMILGVLRDEAKMDIKDFDYIVGRGGLIKPVASGIYEVNDALKHDLQIGVQGEHASNLGGLIASDLARLNGHAKAYIADPVVVDELDDVARITGHPAFERVSIFHALNQKAIARTYAKEHGKKYEELNLIVVHLGGGISVGAHRQGRIVDVDNCLDGNGPFSPERSGSLPSGALVDACFSGKYTKAQLKKMVCGQGGYVAYLGTNDAYEVELRVKAGDKKAALIEQAMIYQVSKEVGAQATVLKGKVDAILITGGIARGKAFVEDIKERVSFIAPVFVYPGEDEMKALAMNAYMLHNGEIEAKVYA